VSSVADILHNTQIIIFPRIVVIYYRFWKRFILKGYFKNTTSNIPHGFKKKTQI